MVVIPSHEPSRVVIVIQREHSILRAKAMFEGRRVVVRRVS